MTRKKRTKSEDNLTPDERWRQGVDHDPRSEALYEDLAALDYAYNNDFFSFKEGGDGDNGEELMYLLDMVFHERDKETE